MCVGSGTRLWWGGPEESKKDGFGGPSPTRATRRIGGNDED